MNLMPALPEHLFLAQAFTDQGNCEKHVVRRGRGSRSDAAGRTAAPYRAAKASDQATRKRNRDSEAGTAEASLATGSNRKEKKGRARHRDARCEPMTS